MKDKYFDETDVDNIHFIMLLHLRHNAQNFLEDYEAILEHPIYAHVALFSRMLIKKMDNDFYKELEKYTLFADTVTKEELEKEPKGQLRLK
jgi:hypothetical protein